MTLAALLERYAATALAGGSPKTISLHRLALARFGETLGRDPELADLTDENLGRHVNSRLAAGKARATVSGEQRKILALWRYAARKGLAPWPESRAMPYPVRAGRAWTQDELRRLWAALDFAAPVGDCPGPWWWRAFVASLWDTGERLSAMQALLWCDVDLSAPSLYLPAEVRKAGRVDRAYRISPETAAHIDRLPRSWPGPFHWPHNRQTLYNRFRGLLERAELPTDRASMFHRIRRSTASHYKAAGGDATRYLGHSSPRVTEGYLDGRIVREPAPCDVLFRPGA